MIDIDNLEQYEDSYLESIFEELSKEYNISDLAIQRLIEHYVDNKTIAEIAAQECVEEQTIKQSIRRTRRKLGL